MNFLVINSILFLILSIGIQASVFAHSNRCENVLRVTSENLESIDNVLRSLAALQIKIQTTNREQSAEYLQKFNSEMSMLINNSMWSVDVQKRYFDILKQELNNQIKRSIVISTDVQKNKSTVRQQLNEFYEPTIFYDVEKEKWSLPTLSEDGRRLYYHSTKGELIVKDVETGIELVFLRVEGEILYSEVLEIDSRGDLVIIKHDTESSIEDEVSLVKRAKGSARNVSELGKVIAGSLIFTDKPKHKVFAVSNDEVRVFDVATEKEMDRFELKGVPDYKPNILKSFLNNTEDKLIAVFETRVMVFDLKGNLLRTIERPSGKAFEGNSRLTSIAIKKDLSQVYFANFHGEVYLKNFSNTGKSVGRLKKIFESKSGLTFSALQLIKNETKLVIVENDGFKVMNLQNMTIEANDLALSNGNQSRGFFSSDSANVQVFVKDVSLEVESLQVVKLKPFLDVAK